MSVRPGRANTARPSLVSFIQTEDGKSTHPSIENPFGFPLPVAGATIVSEEVVKEGHLVKNLKRRLFTLFIDSDNFPCLSYSCVSSRACCHTTLPLVDICVYQRSKIKRRK
jgi:hypothetical protein